MSHLEAAHPSRNDCSGATTPDKSSTIPINLTIGQGVIFQYLPNNEARVSMLNLHQEKTLRITFDLPVSMTKAEFEAEFEQRIHSYFGIDVTAHRRDHGGTGSPKHITCIIDVEGGGREERMTTLGNVLNEETWEAAKGLMRVAKGETRVEVCFAVRKGTFFERLLIRLFLT